MTTEVTEITDEKYIAFTGTSSANAVIRRRSQDMVISLIAGAYAMTPDGPVDTNGKL